MERGSGEGLNPHCLPGPLTRFAQNRWENIGVGPTPHPLNVAPANTLVLVAHLVTFSESQWNQFHPMAKKPTDSAPGLGHLLQNYARTNSQNDHLIIKFVTNHSICNKCNNEVNFYRASAYWRASQHTDVRYWYSKSVRLSVTLQYQMKMVSHIVTVFSPYGIILVLPASNICTKFRRGR